MSGYYPQTLISPTKMSRSTLAHRGINKWSGRWESNPRLKLGKLGYYHYTTPAQGGFYAPGRGQRKSTGPGAARRLVALLERGRGAGGIPPGVDQFTTA